MKSWHYIDLTKQTRHDYNHTTQKHLRKTFPVITWTYTVDFLK